MHIQEEYNLTYLTSTFPSKREKGLYILDLPYDKPPEEIEKNRRARAAAKRAETIRKKQALLQKKETEEKLLADQQAQASGQVLAGASAGGMGAVGSLGRLPPAPPGSSGHMIPENATSSVPTASAVGTLSTIPVNEATPSQFPTHGFPSSDLTFVPSAPGQQPQGSQAANSAIDEKSFERKDVTMDDTEVRKHVEVTADGHQESLPEASSAAQELDEEEADTITWLRTILYTTTLERMQKKLYYDQYFCVSAFVSDLERIVHNAEAAEVVDRERALKAHQMLNMATILLDQYVDAAFRAECERMAARVAKREQADKERERAEKEKQKEKEKEKEKEKDQEEKRRLDQEREDQKSRLEGEPSVHHQTTHFPAGLVDIHSPWAQQSDLGTRDYGSAQGLRPLPAPLLPDSSRDSSTAAQTHAMNGAKRLHDEEGDSQESGVKRTRLDSPAAFAAPAFGATHLPDVHPPQEAVHRPHDRAVGGGRSHLPPPSQPSQPSSLPSTSVGQTVHLSSKAVATVRAKFAQLEGFSVEDLEAVRAKCFDVFWHHRMLWDRDPVAHMMLEAIERAVATRDRRLKVAAQRAAEALE